MKLKIVILFQFFLLVIQAQNKEKNTQVNMPKIGAYPDKDVVVYKNALSVGDLECATYALHNIIAANPNGGIYKDTLALVYLQRGLFLQAQAIVKPLISEKENNTRIEVLAICAKQLGQTTEAIDLYSKLYVATKNNNYVFEKLQLEYRIKRLVEAKQTADFLLAALTTDDKTTLAVPKLDNKTSQQIAFKAGVHYILGNIYYDMNDKALAQQEFEKALKIQPDYELASHAIQLLKESSDMKSLNNK